jgi:DNA phosphorothioation-associated putative methyltransferase
LVRCRPRYRKRSTQRFEEHLEDLQPLIDFITDRGRLPRNGELANEAILVRDFGSPRAAFSLIRRVTGPDAMGGLEAEARQNFLVYVALSAFGGRPKFSDLPHDLQYDAKDLFGSYTNACAEADRLLRSIADSEAINAACNAAGFGKLTPEALYVHVDYVADLPPLLRVYEGAARSISGNVDDATLVKINRIKPQVSSLCTRTSTPTRTPRWRRRSSPSSARSDSSTATSATATTHRSCTARTLSCRRVTPALRSSSD